MFKTVHLCCMCCRGARSSRKARKRRLKLVKVSGAPQEHNGASGARLRADLQRCRDGESGVRRGECCVTQTDSSGHWTWRSAMACDACEGAETRVTRVEPVSTGSRAARTSHTVSRTECPNSHSCQWPGKQGEVGAAPGLLHACCFCSASAKLQLAACQVHVEPSGEVAPVWQHRVVQQIDCGNEVMVPISDAAAKSSSCLLYTSPSPRDRG